MVLVAIFSSSSAAAMPPHSTTLLEHAQQAHVHVADLAQHGTLLNLHGSSTEHG
jgi:hypothetical protein